LQAKQVATDEERGRLLATGKKIFVERCAKCHDERGDKPLKTGPPLSQRELSDEEIARAVSGRLKNAPDEEKRAVAVYVSSFIKRK
jgi:mono/diheme cytochrome c family protein